MTSDSRINWQAAALLWVLVVGLAVFSLLMVAADGAQEGRPNGLLVWSGAFGLGLILGSAAEISGALRPRIYGVPAKLRITAGFLLGATGLALLIRAFVPQVFGWNIGILAGALLAGLVLPVLTGALWREFRRRREG